MYHRSATLDDDTDGSFSWLFLMRHLMDAFNCFSDFTPVSEEEFDAVVKRILNDSEDDEDEELTWTIEGQKIFNVMAPAILSYVNFAMDYNRYVTDEANALSETSNVCNKCVVHPHDIMLDDYTIIEHYIVYTVQ